MQATKLTLIFLLFLLFGLNLSAQNTGVAINPDGTLPHSSAILDVDSNDKGVLLPRLTEAQRNNIPMPAPGLLIFQTNEDQGFYFFNGSNWEKIGDADNLGNHTATQNLQTNGNWISNDGSNNGLFLSNDNRVGLNNNNPDAAFHVNTQGSSFGIQWNDTQNNHQIYMGTPGGRTGMQFNRSDNAGNYQGFVMRNVPNSNENNRYFFFNFIGDSENTFVLRKGGNIGFGTTAPSAQLHTTGTIRFQNLGGGGNRMLVTDNSGNITATAIPANTDNQTLSISGQNLSISGGNSVTLPNNADNLGNHTATQNLQTNGNWISNDGGNNGIFIDGNGRIGIGYESPTEELDINGQISANTRLKLKPEGTTLFDQAGEFHIHNLDSRTTFWRTGRGSILTLRQTGNVGIGTINPTAQLHTNGTIRFQSLGGGGNRMLITNNDGELSATAIPVNTDNQTLSITGQDLSISGGNSVTLPEQWSLTGNTGLNASNFIGSTDDNPLRFRVNNVEAMTLRENETLKLTTRAGYNALTTPLNNRGNSALHLSANSGDRSEAAIAFDVEPAFGGRMQEGFLTFKKFTNNGDGSASTNGSQFIFSLKANAGGGINNVLTISNNGSVGVSGRLGVPEAVINRASGPAISEINATNNNSNNYNNIFNLSLRNSNNAMNFYVSGTFNNRVGMLQVGHSDPAFSANVGSLLLNPLGGNIGMGTFTPNHPLQMASGAHVTTAGTWTNASDARLKTNIINSHYGLNQVLQLRPVAYQMKANGEQQIGFIAQEVQPILPEVVSGTEGDLEKLEVLGISYGNLVPVLTKAIQEQQNIIEDQNKRIEKLEKLVEDLLNR
jgi:hypothetical protein